MKAVAIVGATGYIGKLLVAELLRVGGFNIRILVRKGQSDSFRGLWGGQVEIIEGDLLDLGSLQQLVIAGSTVINLAYLWNEGEAVNLEAVQKLVSAGKSTQVRRLIHCSTADVVGRACGDMTTEATICKPVTEYGKTKLNIESVIVNAAATNFDTVVLRPAAVFGPDSANLRKLSYDLSHGHGWKNYLKSCLFGKRRMNLVHVNNVLAAIIFIILHHEDFKGEIINVAEDDVPKNNFADVEAILMNALRIKPYRVAPVHLPSCVFSISLRLLGKNNINPRCSYDASKLNNLGFKRVIGFEEGLAAYAAWQRSSKTNQDEGVAK